MAFRNVDSCLDMTYGIYGMIPILEVKTRETPCTLLSPRLLLLLHAYAPSTTTTTKELLSTPATSIRTP
jgi:hypothetical protein